MYDEDGSEVKLFSGWWPTIFEIICFIGIVVMVIILLANI